MTDTEKIVAVNKWFSRNYDMFKLDEYYGLDICAELFDLVSKCSSDGDDKVSTGQVSN